MNKDKRVIELIKDAKHQQDLLMDVGGVCRCIPAGTHGSTPHLLKILIKYEDKND